MEKLGIRKVRCHRIEYSYVDGDVVCVFREYAGEAEVRKEVLPREYIAGLRLKGWNTRSLGVRGFVAEHATQYVEVEVDEAEVYQEPDIDVLTGGLWIDDSKLMDEYRRK